MRGSGFFVLVMLVIICGLTWAVLWGPLRDLPLLRPAVQSVQPAPEAPAGAAQDKASAEVRKKTGSRKNSAANEPEVLEIRPLEQPAAAVAQSPPARFPTAVDVPIGMQGSGIVAAFGPPVARTTGLDQAGRVEIFIYRRSDPDTATVIQLRNGRVVSATTTAY
jgi:uncharacterized iron-regulated membrane protein